LSRLTQIAPPPTRFVFLGAGIRLGLPSHPASRRRSCLRLGVSITSSSRGLSPPSGRPCRAYSRRRRCAAPLARRQRRRSALGGPRGARRAICGQTPQSVGSSAKSARAVLSSCLGSDRPARGRHVKGRLDASLSEASALDPVQGAAPPVLSTPATLRALNPRQNRPENTPGPPLLGGQDINLRDVSLAAANDASKP
jgi:hypothetical protein